MQQEKSPEFQPTMVASFDRSQLIKVFAWGKRNSVSGKETFDRALESAQYDEVGKVMDEESRNRLRYGVAVLTGLAEVKLSLNNLLEAQVWQKTPDESDLTVRVIKGARGIQN